MTTPSISRLTLATCVVIVGIAGPYRADQRPRASARVGEKLRETSTPEPGTPTRAAAHVRASQVPLHFELNTGQFAREVRFASRTPTSTLFLTASEATLIMAEPRVPRDGIAVGQTHHKRVAAAVRLRPVGGRHDVRPAALDPLRARINVVRGKDRSRWRHDVPAFGRVRYSESIRAWIWSSTVPAESSVTISTSPRAPIRRASPWHSTAPRVRGATPLAIC